MTEQTKAYIDTPEAGKRRVPHAQAAVSEKIAPHTNRNKLYIDPTELSERIGICTGTLAQWRFRRVGIPYLKFGQLDRYRISDVEAFEARSMIEVAA
jgi:hypothetical protein